MKVLSKFLVILIAMLSSQLGFNIDSDNIQDYLDPNAECVADYITENLDNFKEEYNKSNQNELEPFTANFVEHKKIVINRNTGKKAVYLDFDKENGYILIADNYEILDFQVTGDLSKINNYTNTIYYGIYDGFMYKENNELIPFNIITESEDYWKNIKFGYSGQEVNGEATITNPTTYISSRYGSGYSVHQERNLSNFYIRKQNDYNSYRKYINGTYYNEANCGLSSIYGMLSYLKANKGFSKFPSTISWYNPQTQDPYYDEIISTGYSKYYRAIPDLYLGIRKMAMDNHGYRTGGVSAFTSIIEETADFYGEDIDATLKIILDFEDTVITEINAGYPVLWNTAHGYYGSHSTIVIGYKTYVKTTKVWFMTFHTYQKLLKLNDNHRSYSTYFDFDAYTNSGKMAVFVKAR